MFEHCESALETRLCSSSRTSGRRGCSPPPLQLHRFSQVMELADGVNYGLEHSNEMHHDVWTQQSPPPTIPRFILSAPFPMTASQGLRDISPAMTSQGYVSPVDYRGVSQHIPGVLWRQANVSPIPTPPARLPACPPAHLPTCPSGRLHVKLVKPVDPLRPDLANPSHDSGMELAEAMTSDLRPLDNYSLEPIRARKRSSDDDTSGRLSVGCNGDQRTMKRACLAYLLKNTPDYPSRQQPLASHLGTHEATAYHHVQPHDRERSRISATPIARCRAPASRSNPTQDSCSRLKVYLVKHK